MSINREVKVTCPHCDAVSPFQIWLSVNTAQNPELKGSIRDRSLFQFECPYCGEKTAVDYGMLYHDPDNKELIHYAINKENADEVYHMLTDDDKKGAFSSIFDQKYLIRIVRSKNQLLEKLALFDAEYDDRLIELYKYHLEKAFREEHPESENVEILFFSDPEGNPMLQIFNNCETQGVVPLNNSSYYELLQKHEKEMRDFREDDPVVDQEWVKTFLSPAYFEKPDIPRNTDYEIN
ncbi:MAG: CpXC domain-containing protein [Oscillospiraceae bacterium]|nr:CpXC domain-containing protein [Oscillospiraceae bacterium]